MSYIYPRIGPTYQSDKACTFTVWAPNKNRVSLVLVSAGGEKHYDLQPDERGFWSRTIQGVSPGVGYKFRLDDQEEYPDPASRFQPEGVHGPSEVIDEDFDWQDHQWKGIALKDMVIYELHVGTFSESGDFQGVIDKLDYLRELGINAIELMPVAQFPGGRNWGYDGVYPFAVQNTYGGPEMLKELVNAAHQKGIAIILDVVYNHQGPEGNYFAEYAPYFTDRYKTFWGKAINFDDAYCDGVRHFYWQNALMWLDEYRIDGLRLDAVHAIWDFSADPFIAELARKVESLQTETGREKVLIAEFDLNNPRYISSKQRGGYNLDGQWIDEFHHALHALITNERDGYYEDFGDAGHLAKSLQQSYVYTGEYSVHRKKHFGVPAVENAFGQFVVFSQNHDQIGNRLMGDRLTNTLSFEALKLVAATVLLAPQVPMLFMGEEYAEKKPFQYFISHTDEALVEMVRSGRRNEFAYFNWEGPIPDPQSEDTFQQCVLSWESRDKYQNRLFELYKYLIAFRKKRMVYQGQSQDTMRVFEPGINKVIAFERIFGTDRILVVLNYDPSTAPFKLPSAAAMPSRKIFDSASLNWLGPGEVTFSDFNTNNEILMHGHSAVIFEY